MSAQTCDKGLASHSALTRFMPPNRNRALTTPMSAPPAMNPLAMRVPFSPRSLFVSASLERVVTYQFMAPPTSSGMLSSIGMNMPKAKASAGTLQIVSTIAMIAPMP